MNDTGNPLALHTGINYALGNNQGETRSDPAAEELAQARAQIGVGLATHGDAA